MPSVIKICNQMFILSPLQCHRENLHCSKSLRLLKFKNQVFFRRQILETPQYEIYMKDKEICIVHQQNYLTCSILVLSPEPLQRLQKNIASLTLYLSETSPTLFKWDKTTHLSRLWQRAVLSWVAAENKENLNSEKLRKI